MRVKAAQKKRSKVLERYKVVERYTVVDRCKFVERCKGWLTDLCTIICM